MQIVVDNWQQMDLLSEPDRDVRIGKLDALASELAAADATTINQVVKAHRLNDKEIELLFELLHINYILK